MKDLKISFFKLHTQTKIGLLLIITIWMLITVALIFEIDTVKEVTKYLAKMISPELVAYSGLVFIGREFFVRVGKIVTLLDLYQRDTRRSFRLTDRNIDKHQDEIKKIHKELTELKTELHTIKEMLKK